MARRIPWKQLVFRLAFVALALAVLALLLTLHPGHKLNAGADGLPAVDLQQVQGFRAYYFTKNPTDFTLVASSVNYQDGVLIFSLQNPTGQSLAITEEATPPHFDVSSLRADKQFTTEYGQAFVTDAVDRTTGALFTTDHTWLLINAPTPIGASLMQTVLGALAPVR